MIRPTEPEQEPSMEPWMYAAIAFGAMLLLAGIINVAMGAHWRRKADRTDDPQEAHRLRMAAKGLAPDGTKLSGSDSGVGTTGASGGGV